MSTIRIRLDLDGEPASKFQEAKEARGVKSNTEFIRILIFDEWNRLFRNHQNGSNSNSD